MQSTKKSAKPSVAVTPRALGGRAGTKEGFTAEQDGSIPWCVNPETLVGPENDGLFRGWLQPPESCNDSPVAFRGGITEGPDAAPEDLDVVFDL